MVGIIIRGGGIGAGCGLLLLQFMLHVVGVLEPLLLLLLLHELLLVVTKLLPVALLVLIHIAFAAIVGVLVVGISIVQLVGDLRDVEGRKYVIFFVFINGGQGEISGTC